MATVSRGECGLQYGIDEALSLKASEEELVVDEGLEAADRVQAEVRVRRHLYAW